MKKRLHEVSTPIDTVKATNAFMKISPKYYAEEYSSHNKLHNKNVVITAADNGVSKAIAFAFAKEGANIALIYNHQSKEKEVKGLVKKIEDIGRKVWLFKSCTFDEFKCKRLLQNVLKKIDSIDVLINTFPIYNKKSSETGHYLLRKTDTLKIQSLFTIGKIAPEFMSQSGVIINSGTLCAYAEPDQLVFYSALKAAIKNYTHEMNRYISLNKHNLRINGITTGFIWSETLPDALPDYEHLPVNIDSSVPLHPYEVAPLYVFLASDDARSIAGQTIDAGGKIHRY